MTFSIIIPTIFRDTLQRTLDSIEIQSHPDYEVIVIYDGVETPELKTVAEGYETDKVKVHFTGEKSGDWGHTPRKIAWDLVTGDYILYMDDDDWFINDTMAVIAKELGDKRPEWGVFPALRMGEIFHNLPPAASMTTSIQHFHKKFDSEGNEIRWMSGWYGKDGEWIEEMKKKYEPYILDTEPLVRVEEIHHGA